jgi:hypothetical protein
MCHPSPRAEHNVSEFKAERNSNATRPAIPIVLDDGRGCREYERASSRTRGRSGGAISAMGMEAADKEIVIISAERR